MCDGGFSDERTRRRKSQVIKMYSTTYRGLLYNDALDVKVLKLNVLRIRVGLSVLEEASDELDGLLGPATYKFHIPIEICAVYLN